MGSRSLVLDVAVGVALVYAGVCIYEGANFLALSALGAHAAVTFEGVLPVGVSASVTQGSVLLLAKPVQIAVSVLAMLAVFRATRSVGTISRTLSLTTLSLYLASAYWELFSSVGPQSYDAHLAIFMGLAIAAQLGLTSLLDGRGAPAARHPIMQEL